MTVSRYYVVVQLEVFQEGGWAGHGETLQLESGVFQDSYGLKLSLGVKF